MASCNLPLLPYRGPFGSPRPARLADLPLPPAPMPSHWAGRPLKAWRYIGVFGPEMMLCLARVRIGRGRQSFWALWDRQAQTLYERTTFRAGTVQLAPGRGHLADGTVEIELRFAESAGVESVCRAGQAYAWTRKQAGIAVQGTVTVSGHPRRLDGWAVIDDTAAYYPRHTSWRWSAGVGRAVDGRALAWNLVSGVNDPATDSERTVWLAGEPHEAAPCEFAADLSAVGALGFAAEAARSRSDNLGLLRSRYRQPFGTFSGRLPGGIELAEGFGVMEEHEAWW